MPTPAQMMLNVAVLMNDSAQSVYTNTIVLPYYNMAQRILQELFELNNIPVTNRTSATINIVAGITKVGFDTVPALPSDLIEIQELWESPEGLNQWTPVVKNDFLPHYLQNTTTISQFLIYAWKNQAIELIAANADNDLKLDYIASLFVPVVAGTVGFNVAVLNTQTFLEFETAAICSLFIAENPSRAEELNSFAGDALNRSLGISIKGMQSITTRRRPFRAAYKTRGMVY